MICHRQIRRLHPQQLAAGSRGGRAGAIYLEFLLVFPIVFVATMAIFQFGLLSLAIQDATNAVIEGGRTAAAAYPSGASNDDIADAVMAVMNKHLAVQGLKIGGGGTAQIIVERGTGSSETRGTLPGSFMTVPSGPALDSTEARVTLAFPLVSPTDTDNYGKPVPDWLGWIGFSLSNYKFQLSSRATLE